MRTKRKILKIRFSDHQLDSLKKIAFQMNTTVSDVIRYSIDQIIETTNRLVDQGLDLKDISKLKTDEKP